jgi:hypothetical protein
VGRQMQGQGPLLRLEQLFWQPVRNWQAEGE